MQTQQHCNSAQAILRLPQVLQRTGISRSTIYGKIKAGTFPAPISLGARAVGFLNTEIDMWIESCVASSRLTRKEQ
jgi:prophage regulatory protein